MTGGTHKSTRTTTRNDIELHLSPLLVGSLCCERLLIDAYESSHMGLHLVQPDRTQRLIRDDCRNRQLSTWSRK